MADQAERKCFTFTWVVENFSYCWQNVYEYLQSPTFVVKALQNAKCYLSLYPKGLSGDNYMCFYFLTAGHASHESIDCELAFLSEDGSALASMVWKDCDDIAGTFKFKERDEVFVTNRSAYLPEGRLTARCRIWKCSEDFVESVQCFARTQICVEREAFLWKIRNVDAKSSEEIATHQIKSLMDNELMMTFEIFAKNPYTEEDSISILLRAESDKIKHFVLRVTPLNASGGPMPSVRKEFSFCEDRKLKLLTLPFSKNDLIANNMGLQPDVLSLRCECTFSTGKIVKEILNVFYGCHPFSTTAAADAAYLDEENTRVLSKSTLHGDLKTLFRENVLSDVKLKTSAETYLAHKSLLSARSPVFKAMFENDMQAKFSKCVHIEDLDDDTVYKMLHYVYTAEVLDLQIESAFNLYRAADKYDIRALRNECSAYLKSNLCPNNACEILIFADLYKDECLKTCVQDYILIHGVVASNEWKDLLATHPSLAACTMYLHFEGKKRD